MGAGDLIAIVSLLVAVLALFVSLLKEDFRRRFRAPKLRVEPSVSLFGVGEPPVGHAYARLKVAVAEGRGTVKGVQALLISCEPAAKLGGRFSGFEAEILRPLRWSFQHEARADIPQGGARYLDVLEVAGDQPSVARLSVVNAPKEGILLEKRADLDYKMSILIVGDDVPPQRVRLTVKHSGEWQGSEPPRKNDLDMRVD